MWLFCKKEKKGNVEYNLGAAFKEIFFKEMSTIKAFSKKEVKAIYGLMSDGEGGYTNKERYQDPIFKDYFQDRVWIWPEFEKWSELFASINQHPREWIKNRDDSSKTSEKRRAEIYVLLIQTILGRANTLYQKKLNEEAGHTASTVVALFEEDKNLVNLAINKTPFALAPLFPGDASFHVPIVESAEERAAWQAKY